MTLTDSPYARAPKRRRAIKKRDPADRARLEMNRLRDLLAARWWTARDAAYIFAGLHPEHTMGEPRGEWGPCWLPGARERFAPREDRAAHGLEVEATLEELRDVFTGEARKPADWLKRAASLGIEPPWLSAAVQDAACAGRLPQKWRANAGAVARGERRGVAGGKANREKNGFLEALYEPLFLPLYRSYLVNGRFPRGQREGLISQMVGIHKEETGIDLKESCLRTKLTEWQRRAREQK